MLERWRAAPTWMLAVGMGSFFAAGMFGFSLLQGVPRVAALLGAVVAGVLFGTFMGPWAARTRRQDRDAASGSDATYSAASKSLRWRRPPLQTDAERTAAADLARHRLQLLDSQRLWGTAVLVGISAVAVWLAVTRSSWWWLEVAFFAVVIGVTWVQRRRLRRILGES